MEFHELKNFCKGKNTIIRTKQPPTELKMISPTTNPIHETMYLKYIKNFKKKHFKMGYILNRNFSKEKPQKAKKHLNNCSTSLAIREMQGKHQPSYIL